jgi:hypothetical protein
LLWNVAEVTSFFSSLLLFVSICSIFFFGFDASPLIQGMRKFSERAWVTPWEMRNPKDASTITKPRNLCNK